MKQNLLILFLSIGLMSFQINFGSESTSGDLKLGQNYPNPAITLTYIDAKFIGEGTLTVYNVVGKIIEERTVNSGIISIDVSSYNEGVYLYTLEANGEKLTKRMTVKKP